MEHVEQFEALLKKGDLQDDYTEFIKIYDKFRCDTILQFSFENPKKDVWT